jgi:hypothetical protein
MTARPARSRPPRASRAGEAALRYAAHGWPVLPLHTPTRDGCSCGHPACPKPGKHPRTRRGLRDASSDPAQIRAWWTRWPHANVALATGRLVIVDVDGPAGRAALTALERAHAPLPVTLTAATGRGAHLYFDAGQQRIASSAGRLGDGLDVRGHGGYGIVPPQPPRRRPALPLDDPHAPRAAARLAGRAAHRRRAGAAARTAARGCRRPPAALLRCCAARRARRRRQRTARRAQRHAQPRRVPARPARRRRPRQPRRARRAAARRRPRVRACRARGARDDRQRPARRRAAPASYASVTRARPRYPRARCVSRLLASLYASTAS